MTIAAVLRCIGMVDFRSRVDTAILDGRQYTGNSFHSEDDVLKRPFQNTALKLVQPEEHNQV
jgi:hypothetical protein